MDEIGRQRTGSGGGCANALVGIAIVLVTGIVVSTGVGCFVVSTNAPQFASFDDDVVVVWWNGWSTPK